MHLTGLDDGNWQKHFWDREQRKEIAVPVHFGEELLTFADMDLSYLVPLDAAFMKEGQSLLWQEGGFSIEEYIDFQAKLLELIKGIYDHDAFLGDLAESGLCEYDAYGAPDPYAEDIDTGDLFEIIGLGMQLPGRILRTHFMVTQALEDCFSKAPLDRNIWIPALLTSFVSLRLDFVKGKSCRTLVFDSTRQYYSFMLHSFLSSGQQLLRCERCGRLFLQEGKRAPKYCLRTDEKGRTCRQLGPTERHKETARLDPVIEAFDRAKRRMYKRMERSQDKLEPSPSSLSLNKYYTWLTKAESVRADYLAKRISTEDALQQLNEQ